MAQTAQVPDATKDLKPASATKGATTGSIQSMLPKVEDSIPQSARTARGQNSGVTLESIMKFLFPPTVEHPESTGRLELFARYGPVDDEGLLRGGIRGGHVHTRSEVRQMIKWSTREALFSIFKKPRSTVEVVVDLLMPAALAHNYTTAEIHKMLRDVERDKDGRMNFFEVQCVILDRQRKRLEALRDGMEEKGHTLKVPFQSKAEHHLTAVMRKKKKTDQEEALFKLKRLHGYSTLVATLDDQNLSNQIAGNVALCRDKGHYSDKWDRYCSVRNTGKACYVSARNQPRTSGHDDGLADQHPGCSSLVATSMHSLARR